MSKACVTILLVATFAAALPTATAAEQAPAPETEWVKLLAAVDSLDCPCLAATQDGGLVLATGGYLVKLSAAGDEQWRRPHNAPGGPESMVALHNGGFLLLNQDSAWAGRHNDKGDLVAQRTYQGEFTQLLSGMEIDNGHFVLCGRWNDDAWLLEVDSELEPVWQQTYDAGAEELVVAIVPGPDGGYVVACNSGEYSKFGTGPSQIWVFKCDAQGQMLAEYRTPGIMRYVGRRYLAQSDNHYYVCFARAQGLNTDTWLVKLDGDLKEAWGRYLGTKALSAGTSTVVAAGNRVVIAGVQPAPASAEHDRVTGLLSLGPWAMRVDAEGTVVWEAHVPLPRGCYGFRLMDVAATMDGCFLLGSSTTPDDVAGEHAEALVLVKLRDKPAD